MVSVITVILKDFRWRTSTDKLLEDLLQNSDIFLTGKCCRKR